MDEIFILTLHREAVCFSETSVFKYKNTFHHNPEERGLSNAS